MLVFLNMIHWTSKVEHHMTQSPNDFKIDHLFVVSEWTTYS